MPSGRGAGTVGSGGQITPPRGVKHGTSTPHIFWKETFSGTASCQILTPKCTKFVFGWGSAPDPAGLVYNAPQTADGFKGASSKCGPHEFDPPIKNYNSRAPVVRLREFHTDTFSFKILSQRTLARNYYRNMS